MNYNCRCQLVPIMPTDYDRLRRLVAENPTADAPIAVLADWLDAQGRPQEALAWRMNEWQHTINGPCPNAPQPLYQPGNRARLDAEPSRQVAVKAGRQGFVVLPKKRLKAGRNDPCPCGSGKKVKRCCRERVESRGLNNGR